MSEKEFQTEEASVSRRSFVKGASLSAAALGLTGANLYAAEGKKKLKVGVVGLGGRGSGAVKDILEADPDVVIWSAAEIFEKPMKNLTKLASRFEGRIDTDGGQREFIGFDGYQKVIDSGVDLVLLTSTPAFRPEHFKAAVAAGKHVFMEKPFALDIPGLMSVVEDAKKAQNNGQSVMTGLVWRYTPHLMELHKRIQDGAIGDVLNVSSAYSGGRPNKMPDLKYKPKSMTDMEWAQRFWQNYLELSGDCALEFMIHGIDRMSWAMGDDIPKICYANGGNIVPVPGANNWDSFSMRFEYEDGRTADFMGRQIPGTFCPVGDTITGSKGRALAMGMDAAIVVGGKTVWESSSEGLGYVNEHKILLDHIRKGEVFNDVIEQMGNSHAVAIMGRQAAYTGTLITGEQIMASKDLLVDTKGMTFDTPFTPREAALQGKTKFI